MTTDTIFDVASLTKVVATTTSVMMLLEQGRIGLDDAVATYIPEFGRYGKQRITIRHLLTHVSGLRGDLDLALEFKGAEAAIRLAAEEVPVAAPGQRFIYSDINFFLLGEIVARVSGQRLDAFARTHIFEPLGMRETTFLPRRRCVRGSRPLNRVRRSAWPCGGPPERCCAASCTIRRRDAWAAWPGHAGLFSTAADLSRFCRMLLKGGTLDGVRVLSPLTVALMTRPATPAALGQVRGLGWDIDSRFAVNRGALFPIGSFGHTGWTGPSLWIDPITRMFVVFLANRVHPDGKGDVVALARARSPPSWPPRSLRPPRRATCAWSAATSARIRRAAPPVSNGRASAERDRRARGRSVRHPARQAGGARHQPYGPLA